MGLTNKEIARRLGISETTLSFIINNKPGIAEKTRTRVIREITALGYGHLFKKETPPLSRNICFVIHKRHGGILNQSPFYSLLMEQIEEHARNAGFNLIVRLIDPTDSIEEHIRHLNGSGISGIIVFATEMLDDDMDHFKLASVPVVSMDNDFTHIDFDSVVINNRVGTFQAVEHLFANGHRTIGYLQCKTYINSFGERDAGYQKALRHFGLELSPRHRFQVGYTEEESYQDFRKILASGADLPSAFVSDDDTLSVGVMRALIEHGVSVPEEVSLVGFNDRPVCRLTQPQLSSISVPKDRFGALALDLLIDRMSTHRDAGRDCRKVELGVGFVERGSTCNLASQALILPAGV